ncbi:trimethyllysine dioxygenase [Synchytrium microbalum]|uniref:trimethyllysine dioxygenase n=1 Tax=Synchytrium microbalum TaxID=1806994 RepID=A0A507CAR6_9FUNG|nr:trimethyllysine dioxygenase [Synchytrium microbalum]TPX36712.1 trimethyllysine dioxygenase [Synchytrium microbalum]
MFPRARQIASKAVHIESGLATPSIHISRTIKPITRLQHSQTQPVSNTITYGNPHQISIPAKRTRSPIRFGGNAAIQPNLQTDNTVIGPSARIENGRLVVRFTDGLETAFNMIWLRDHCRCPKCYHTVTKQRLVDTFSIPRDIRPSTIHVENTEHVVINWNHDNHTSTFPLSWLREHSYAPKLAAPRVTRQKKLWGAELIENLPVTNYEDVMGGDEGLAQWLYCLDVYGFGIVDGCPPTPEDTEKLIQRISFIRRTHYGDFWDFTADLEHGDTAYTTMALPAHTDNTYFTDPAGLQVFHMLSNTCQGGKSLYVDGFHIASQLSSQNPWAHHALSTIRTPAHAAGDKTQIIQPNPSTFPLLNLDPTTHELYQVRYNNDDRSILSNLSPKEIELYYDALREWIRLVRAPENELWMQLVPGRVVAMDNWRVLHGRSSFGVGIRRVAGAYVGNDDWKSRMRVVLDRSDARERI